MLLRATMAVRSYDFGNRLASLIDGRYLRVRVLSGTSLEWSRIAQMAGDMLVVEETLIPSPKIETVRSFLAQEEAPKMVVLVHQENAEQRARLLAAGCEAVLPLELSFERLAETLKSIIARRVEEAARWTSARPETEMPALEHFDSKNASMRNLMETVRRLVDSDVSLLIQGETGTGKEWLARAIHNAGLRRAGPFVAVNCGALPEQLLESELFGHEEGAFTGATRPRRGMFELAHGGTLFLDEVGEIPLHLQVKLLRALQDHVIQPIGAEEPVLVDVRVMAATNRDLAADVQMELFRRDLYYRLSPVTLTLPPLRERREDIPDLVRFHLARLHRRIHRPVSDISPEALECFCRYDWPGNIRELINVLERAMLLCKGTVIQPTDLPESVRQPAWNAGGMQAAEIRSCTEAHPWRERRWREVRAQALEEIERAYFSALLQECNGRIGETARRAGMSTRSLFERLRKLGIRKENFRRKPTAPPSYQVRI